MTVRQQLAMHISATSRAAKIQYLAGCIPEGCSALIVGVSGGSRTTTENVIERWIFSERQAVGLSYDAPEPGLDALLVRGDARRLPFADNSFDYVVSNAVIEHVGGIDGARAMLAESARVARRGWYHTTPNRHFLFETHTHIPLLHWLPRRWQESVFRRTCGYAFPPERYWLYTPASARRLAPGVDVDRLSAVGMTLMLRGSNLSPHAGPRPRMTRWPWSRALGRTPTPGSASTRETSASAT